MDRQQLLDGATRPQLWAVLHETVLRVPMGGPAVMREQLLHIADQARKRRVLVQVLPFTAAANAVLNGMASLMTFSDAPPAVYTEGAGTGQLIEEPSLVDQCQRSYDLVRAASLSPAASMTLLESAAEEYSTP
ncbi:DUF5753 domain-containing protein [Streptomyces sp. ACA25]|uniref:DUF5753 domain-containing protein n=1 Tax=Streptomyces sp. ACA25 TaxID=3022596 RepID=UPI002FE09FC3